MFGINCIFARMLNQKEKIVTQAQKTNAEEESDCKGEDKQESGNKAIKANDQHKNDTLSSVPDKNEPINSPPIISVLNTAQKKLTNNYNRNSKRKIEYIIVHYTGTTGSARGIARYFQKGKCEASTHYVLDDESLYQCVEERHVAWHCGTKKIKNPICTNKNSLGVDFCTEKLNAKHISAEDDDWIISDSVRDRLLTLLAELCVKHGIPAEHVVRHYDVTGKLCPRPLCSEIINKQTGNSGNEDWMTFKKDLSVRIQQLSQ